MAKLTTPTWCPVERQGVARVVERRGVTVILILITQVEPPVRSNLQ